MLASTSIIKSILVQTSYLIKVNICLGSYTVTFSIWKTQRKRLLAEKICCISSLKCVIFLTGPAYWGLINPEWWLCTKGRLQSPINIKASKLLFDPNLLSAVYIDKRRVS